MKKFFTLIAAVAMAASVNAQTLSFDTDYTAGNVPAIISANGLVLKVVDTNAKLVVDPNSAYFGTALLLFTLWLHHLQLSEFSAC